LPTFFSFQLRYFNPGLKAFGFGCGYDVEK